MRLYLAGPMTGIPQFNIPAFDAAAKRLRGEGFDVVSPAELDGPKVRRILLASPDGRDDLMALTGESWGDFLARDVKLIADGGIELIAVLPGWDRSRGARLETFVGAALCGLPVVAYEENLPVQVVRPIELVRAWAGIKGIGSLQLLGRAK